MSRRSKREYLTPELTPLIDVVFLLLIFFMVSSVFKNDELALLLKLPKTKQGSSEKSVAKILNVEVSSDSVAIDGRKIAFDELKTELTKINKDSIVNLRVDAGVVYDRLVKVLDLLKENNLENISLITNQNK